VLSRNGKSVAHAYQERVAAGELIDDPAQRQAALKLDRMRGELQQERGGQGLLQRVFGNGAKSSAKTGIYLTGRIGRGKTMLMDSFFESAGISKRRRVHFHPFMQDVHGRLHKLRQGGHGRDAVTAVAKQIAAEVRLLCLDEFQVNDITDAMLLGRLFEALVSHGTFIVVSSNTEPKRLYEEGLNRQLFLPFIKFIEAGFEIITVAGQLDYRLKRITEEGVYVFPLGHEAGAHVRRLWEKLTEGESGAPLDIEVQGRTLKVPIAWNRLARFSFEALCEAPLGAQDYLALANRFDVIFIENIPVLDRRGLDAARRLTLLVDTLYDAEAKVVISADAPLAGLVRGVKGFERTASRLEEMQSAGYWNGKKSLLS
jgi:cell division protein ZapE